MTESRRNKHNKKRHPVRWIIGIIFILILALGGVEFYKLLTVTDSVQVGINKKANKKVRAGKPISILLMGLDTGALGRNNETYGVGNTDTLELATINPKTSKITLTSIPRDTLVKIKSAKGVQYSKINAAYSVGGTKKTEEVVSSLLNTPIDYYALVDMGVLQKVIDSVGGINVNVPFSFTDSHIGNYTFTKGRMHLNGNQALAYSRMRHADPNGDYGRQQRQQQVISATINKLKNINSVGAINKILDATKDGIRTDAPVNDLATLYSHYKSSMNSVEQIHLQGTSAVIDDSDCQVIPTKELQRVSTLNREALGLFDETLSNDESKLYDQQLTYNGTSEYGFKLPDGYTLNTPK